MSTNEKYAIKYLNDICVSKKTGIYKQWIYKKDCYMKMCNYMQKINYSLQDLNIEIKAFDDFKYKDVVFIISLVDWIKEAMDKIMDSILPEVINDFVFSKEFDLKKAIYYLKAIRSFVVGHPLDTTKHKKFGLNGNFICIDVRNPKKTLNLFKDNHYYHLNYDGLFKGKEESCDFNIYCYSYSDDGMKYFRFIGCTFKDIYGVAKLLIEKLYELDKYLKQKRKRKYIELQK